jgi:hypothetical protein
MPERQTVAGAYQKIESHEEICAVRYQALENALGDLKTSIKGYNRAAWVIAVALLGWLGSQVWSQNQARVDRLERPVAAAPLPR